MMKQQRKTGNNPFFLITIDTEGDNLWGKPTHITTRNAKFIPRFQELCEKYGLKPTYLTDYEMANDPFFVEYAKDIIKRNTAEIGMHLHAWNTPPDYNLTENDFYYMPYLIEYPEDIMEKKIDFLTKTLEDTFAIKIQSHRAGRWAFNESYANMLIKYGYKIDCSVTPHLSWPSSLSDPKMQKHCDYTDFPDYPYFIDPQNIQQPGSSPLLEIPNTILKNKNSLIIAPLRKLFPFSIATRALNRFCPQFLWFRPTGKNTKILKKIVDIVRKTARPYIQLTLHSSELMPGGSPTFPDAKSIERLYAELEYIFDYCKDSYRPATLTEFYNLFNEHLYE